MKKPKTLFVDKYFQCLTILFLKYDPFLSILILMHTDTVAVQTNSAPGGNIFQPISSQEHHLAMTDMSLCIKTVFNPSSCTFYAMNHPKHLSPIIAAMQDMPTVSGEKEIDRFVSRKQSYLLWRDSGSAQLVCVVSPGAIHTRPASIKLGH